MSKRWSPPRNLTNDELQDILNSYKYGPIREFLSKKLANIKIVPEAIEEFKSFILTKYPDYDPSIHPKITSSELNSFHSTGVSSI